MIVYIIIVWEYSELVVICVCFFFLMIRRPPRSTQSRSSAASDVYKRQVADMGTPVTTNEINVACRVSGPGANNGMYKLNNLSLIHISEPTRPY